MSDMAIPSELLTIILSRVPAESLIRFRCVGKAWCRLIDDPYFITIHTNQIQKASITSNEIHLLHGNGISRVSLSLNLKLLDIRSIHYSEFRVLHNRKEFVTCNGLILTFDIIKPNFLSIFNPLTKEVHELPPHGDDINYLSGVGFGYDSNKEDYKVFVKLSNGTNSLYSLKSNSWKMIKICSFKIINTGPGVLCNGALHWIGKRVVLPIQNEPSKGDVIVAFDLESEEVRFYSLPHTFNRRCYGFDYDLGKLGGSLYLISFSGSNCSEIWLMDKYGYENSWLMLHSYLDVSAWSRAIRYIKKKEILILFNYGSFTFILIDLKKNNKKIIPMENHVLGRPLVFQPSLVRIPNGVPMILISPQREENNTRVEGSVENNINKSSKSKILKGLFSCFRKSD